MWCFCGLRVTSQKINYYRLFIFLLRQVKDVCCEKKTYQSVKNRNILLCFTDANSTAGWLCRVFIHNKQNNTLLYQIYRN